ncbi:MAG: hypothetical protein Q4C56_04855 [Peptococcaceae bacterium]|nr:hypothetical protein [Peptococcaceae bacterium]
MKSRQISALVLTALGACLNVVGSFIVVALNLPILMDNLGTVFVAFFCGGWYAFPCALLSSLINASFDPFALPFIPAGQTVALFATLLARGVLAGKPVILRAFFISLPTSIVSALISAYIFGGITGSNITYMVQLLHGVFQLSMVASVFIVQVFTDFVDKLIILMIVTTIIRRLPKKYRDKA